MSYLIRGFPQPIGMLSTPACLPRFVARLNMDPSGALGSTGSLAPLATPKIMCIYIYVVSFVYKEHTLYVYIYIYIYMRRDSWQARSCRDWTIELVRNFLQELVGANEASIL